ncbi:hypothetical protein N7504_009579 [Penicillium tannophilum]|nr:hypothetical protein N7504_009579 [Penicillium tannophilum]
MGTQDAEDGYDVVEAVARMDWCNGNVGMAGKSALAISQWFIASQQPPSLKAIAPWEGSGDIYREQFCRGGWFTMSNFDLIAKAIVRGPENSGLEDFEMYRRYPVSSAFWEDKRADISRVKYLVFIRGSGVSSIHTMGSILGYKQEWYELYSVPEPTTELALFFDRYLRDKDNGWEETPKIRWSALQFGDWEAIDDIVLEDFPAPTTDYKEFFLGDNKQLLPSRSLATQRISYDSKDRRSFAEFNYTFQRPARLIGLPKAVLYMSCDAHDDFIVFVILRKKDKNGRNLMHLNFPFDATPVKSIDEIPESEQASLNLHLGSVGILRASHRETDESKSIHPQFPFHPHKRQDKISPELENGIWAMGVDFEEGESISLRVGRQYPSIAKYISFCRPRLEHELNRGKHVVHCSK